MTIQERNKPEIAEYVCPECGVSYWVPPDQNCGDCYFRDDAFVRLVRRASGDGRRARAPVGIVAAREQGKQRRGTP